MYFFRKSKKIIVSQVCLSETNMSPRDPRWLGAWWLGFLIFGGSGLLVGIPLIFFPKHMRKQDVEKTVKQSDKVDTKKLQQLCHEVKGNINNITILILVFLKLLKCYKMFFCFVTLIFF